MKRYQKDVFFHPTNSENKNRRAVKSFKYLGHCLLFFGPPFGELDIKIEQKSKPKDILEFR